VGKDWDTVVDNETVLGRSLIYASAISSWKSTQDGAYDWDTGSWYELDSGGWVQASRELVQYALDPRNFLNETNIFMFEDLSYNSSVQSESGVESIIDGTFMDGSSHDLTYDGKSYSYASALMYAGKVSGVSPYHLATRIIQEQGRGGTGNSISGTVSGYNGYYNYYNQGAYKTATASAVVNGLIYASKTDSATLRPWNTRMKSIVGGAVYIGSRYINRGQDTIYYEKFDMVTPYTHQYMTNVLAPRSESVTASAAYSETTKQNTALEFKIPVYNNMPESACAIPTEEGSQNNALSSLSVSGYSLTPTFSMFTTSYSLIVDNSVSSVEISANAADSSAKVSGTGSHSLSVGDNTITVTVTAASGDTKTYTIQIVRKEGSSSGTGGSSDGGSSGGNSATPAAGFTTDFALDSSTQTISRVGVGSAAKDVLNLINFTGGAYGKIYRADGSENNDIVGTGNKLVIYDAGGNTIAQYTFVIYGDVNGDGKITSMDLLYVKRHILKVSTLEGVYEMAADANRGNDGVTSIDLLYIKRHILDIRYIEQ
jgi:beta-N-acetylglucosaminidase